MNATKWPSLTEFAKYLGTEGICRVEENDKGLHVSWIDNSPEALKRQEALRRKEAQDQGDEQLEQRMIKEQIRRAQANATGRSSKEEDGEARELKRQEGEKITLSFGAKPKQDEPTSKGADESPRHPSQDTSAPTDASKREDSSKPQSTPAGQGGVSLKLGGKPQPKNVFAQAKKNALSSGSKKVSKIEQPKQMSEAERIMREEMDKKRSRGPGGFGFGMPSSKKQRNN